MHAVQSKKYELFLSYSQKDKPWVRMLADRLLAKNVNVFFDEYDILPGQSIPKRIEDALLNSNRILIVLTPSYISSGWTLLERLPIIYEDPDFSQTRVLPILRANCDIPLLIKHLRYIDFREDRKFEEAFQELFVALRANENPRENSTVPEEASLSASQKESSSPIASLLASSTLPIGNTLEFFLESEEAKHRIDDLLKWSVDKILSDQFEEGNANGAWGNQYSSYLRFIYQDEKTPDDLSYYESISISRIIAIALKRYITAFPTSAISSLITSRFSLLQDYVFRHYNPKIGGFGLLSRKKLRGPINIDVDLRHTTQAVLILWELGLVMQSEDMLRQAGAYLKREIESLDYRKERVLTLGVIHRLLTSQASSILILSETNRRALLKRLESTIVERYDSANNSWDLDYDPIRTTRIDNALFLLADLPIHQCVDQECIETLQTAIKRLIETGLVKTNNQNLALPFHDGGGPDIGATLQLLKIAISNQKLFDEYQDRIRQMLNFSITPVSRRPPQFAYSWHLSSLLEIAAL